MEAHDALRAQVATGTYAKKQLHCRDRFIAWSHRSRFALARKLVAPFAGRRLLDYGCGDGTFLALVADLFPSAVGADLAEDHVRECLTRFGSSTRLTFTSISQLLQDHGEAAFDVITCMETLEHCTPETVDEVLANLGRLLAPGGTLIVSVPIEIGPSLLGKEALRAIAAWRRLGDYAHKERYTLRELLTMLLAGPSTGIERPAYPSEYAPGVVKLSHGHKGFNWKSLQKRLERDFRLERRAFSPLGWSRGLVSSQAWFIARGPREGP